jgi:hypothetical protein
MAGFISFVICLALSAGLGMSAYKRSQRGDGRGATRMGAWALVPLGLWLAGFIRLGRKVGDAVAHWGANLVFNPLVWIGIAMLGIAVLMLITVGFSEGSHDDEEPVVDSGKKRRSVGSGSKSPAASATSDDPEVDAILRKHGVS